MIPSGKLITTQRSCAKPSTAKRTVPPPSTKPLVVNCSSRDVVFELQASSAITSQQWAGGMGASRQAAACWRNPTGFPQGQRAGSLLIHRLIAGLLNPQLQLARRGQQLLMGQRPAAGIDAGARQDPHNRHSREQLNQAH